MNFNKLRYFLKMSKDHLEYSLEMEYSISRRYIVTFYVSSHAYECQFYLSI